MQHQLMSEYEGKAWAGLQEQARRREERGVLKPETRRKLQHASTRAGSLAKQVPGAELVAAGFSDALEGLRKTTMDAAMASVRTERVFKRFDAASCEVSSLADIHRLDLRDCDNAMPRISLRSSAIGATHGAAASLAITGLELSTTVSGGASAPLVVGAVAADIAALLAGMGRVVAETGAYYGYDLKSDEEQVFALAIIAYSSAGAGAAKATALAELSRLAQMFARKATWKALSTQPMVKVIQHIYARLGLRLTKAGLAKAVPAVGAVVGAGMNAAALARVAEDAKFAYRMRFLMDKHGLDADEVRQWSVAEERQSAADDDHIVIAGMLVDEEGRAA